MLHSFSKLGFGRLSLIALLSVCFSLCVFSLFFRSKCCWSVSQKLYKPASSRGISVERFLFPHSECGRSLSHADNSVPRQMCASHFPNPDSPFTGTSKDLFHWAVTSHWKTEQLWDLLLFFLQRLNEVFTVFWIENKCGIKSITRRIWAYILKAYSFQYFLLPFDKTLIVFKKVLITI